MPILMCDQPIYYQVWQECPQPAKCCVVIFHGMVEHIGRYAEFATYLNQRGIIVAGLDMRGHGQTGVQQGVLGHLADQDGWQLILADQKQFIAQLKAEHGQIPFVLLGHSMGSFLARQYVNVYPDDFDAAIIMGTGQVDQWYFKIGRLLASLLPAKAPAKLLHQLNFGPANARIKQPRTSYDWLSTDSQAVAAYESDPWCGAMPTNQFYRDLLGGLEEVRQLERQVAFRKAILFISGEEDPIGNYGKAVKVSAIPYQEKGACQLILVPQMRHELLMEHDKIKVYQMIEAFIEYHLQLEKGGTYYD